MINLLPAEQIKKTKFDGIKSWIVTFTTVVLTVYLVALSGWWGWWLYLANRDEQVSEEAKSLTEQIGKLAVREGLVRQVVARAEAVAAETGRSKTAKVATWIIDSRIVVASWGLTEGGEQTVSARSESASLLEEYVENLRKTYPALKAGSVVWNQGGEWQVDLNLSGKEK